MAKKETKPRKPPMSNAEYIGTGGGHCPFCGSENIEGSGHNELDGDNCWNEVECSNCGKRWNDIYTLTGYGELDAGGHEVSTKGKPASVKGMKYYLVKVCGCTDSESPHGPWDNEKERDQAAKDMHKELDQEDAGPFWLNISDKGVPNMGAYTNRFFEEG